MSFGGRRVLVHDHSAGMRDAAVRHPQVAGQQLATRLDDLFGEVASLREVIAAAPVPPYPGDPASPPRLCTPPTQGRTHTPHMFSTPQACYSPYGTGTYGSPAGYRVPPPKVLDISITKSPLKAVEAPALVTKEGKRETREVACTTDLAKDAFVVRSPTHRGRALYDEDVEEDTESGSAASFAARHEILQPENISTTEVVEVQVGRDGKLGLGLTDSLVIDRLSAGHLRNQPCNMERLLGWTITHVNGQAVEKVEDFERRITPTTVLRLELREQAGFIRGPVEVAPSKLAPPERLTFLRCFRRPKGMTFRLPWAGRGGDDASSGDEDEEAEEGEEAEEAEEAYEAEEEAEAA